MHFFYFVLDHRMLEIAVAIKEEFLNLFLYIFHSFQHIYSLGSLPSRLSQIMDKKIESECGGKDQSSDETDAKLFTGKFFGEKNEHKEEAALERQDDHYHDDKMVEKLKLTEAVEEERFPDVAVTGRDEYPGELARRGVCIILENDMFHTNLGLSRRKGSSVDRQLMGDTFSRWTVFT